ncbi:TPA: 5'-methylthioadenosine/S-adenosylhomocysteine nucleosidase [Acinetobacter baumannii]|uniref:5'-methylthioadenosine/S-adenosylhomocysteine nucleosidase n=1 Tax=Acinetobacter baumannii TaxID=470 RepID=UPI001FD70023|nr:5'-methylthioadenosine/S-adenosylhomocysteine nucleosidase [Acinetobacter baumannii]EKV4526907.1 5'-methylthioadenosine/S-adenosylhomocysteine nucleosidase [Acinetobacter baumannii]MDC5062746.1 5'-methylthioadenosine/S-adenosylhomocysteine nucleosidase [Acinetobacter baumannii]HCH8073322.1 5'-methylthioadenosine/S-adenosylhomocysteine nucleosidase [Acinetobacter baumannii]HDF7036263.1 5'-methylthioadenosine/S-adenosylhomocysteine nucleosidase [Acinetobacter baumannii]
MQFKYSLGVISLCSALFLVGCNDDNSSVSQTPTVQEQKQKLQPIIIQGALPVESERMASKLENKTVEKIGGWTFWKGTYNGYPMIISKTRMGMSNSAAATALAIERYKPIAIINQGTAGGHDPDLHVYDIVLGKYATNIGAFRTPKQPLGGGSNSLTWVEAFDVLPTDESDPEPIAIRKFEGDQELLMAAHKVRYDKGEVVEGTIGSADVWNNELDRIQFFHERYGTSVEEMEAASVAQIASQFNVPFLGIRILSNNITNNGAYDLGTGEACQDYVLNVAEEYMKSKLPK